MISEANILPARRNSIAEILKRHWLPLVLALTVLTRIPFLWTGYGADYDAWLVAKSGLTLWNTGIYHESRLPGYPLHEIVSAPLVGLGGSVLSNSATLVITLIAILVWSKIVQKVGTHHKLLVVAFAFAPVVWQHSAVTLDYMWSMLFVLVAVYALLDSRVLLSGVALGLASWFLPSNFIIIIPLACLTYLQSRRPRQLAILLLSAATVSAISFTPLIYKFGLPGWVIATQAKMSDVTDPTMSMRVISFTYRLIYFVGPISMVVAVYSLWRGRGSLKGAMQSREPILVTSIVGTIVVLLLFLWLPLERAYLLPAFPFLLLILDKVSSTRTFAIFTMCLIMSALVNFDVIDANTRRTFHPNIHPGMVIEELANRKSIAPLDRK